MSKKVIFIFLLLFSFLSFGLTFKAGFIWDDHQMIVSNPYIKDFNITNVMHNLFSNAFNREGAIYYRPLQLISYMFDFYFFKLNPLGWHLINFLIHFFNSFLLFLLLKKMSFSDEISFFSSLFFAVNPVVVEQLIIIAGRAELMTLFFSLLSILFYLRSGGINFILSVLFYFLSMLSKESGIITPFLIILCLWFKGEKKYSKSFLIYFLIIPFYLALRKVAVNAPIIEINFYDFVINLVLKMPLVFLNYLQKTLVPFNLYSHNVVGFNVYIYVFALIFIICFKYYIFIVSKSKVYIFSLLWYFIFLIPKLPLFGSQNLVLDHWVYPANIGLFISISYLLHLFKERFIKLYFLAIIIIVSSWVSFSVSNISKRDSDVKIYEHAIQYPTSAHVYYNLGREYYLRGNYIEAKKMIEKVINDYNKDEMFLNAYALVNWKTENDLKAIEILRDIIAHNAKMSVTYTNIASVLVENKKYDEGLKYLFEGLKKFPEDENIKIYIARIFSLKGEKEKSKIFLEEIVGFNPYNQEALFNLGIIEFEVKNLKKSEEYFRRFLEIVPSHPIAVEYLSKIKKRE